MVKALEGVIEGGIIALLILSPLVSGAALPLVNPFLQLAVLLLLAAWLIKLAVLALRGGGRVRSMGPALSTVLPLLIPALAFTGLVLMQMVPLPPRVLKVLSPSTHALYQRTLVEHTLAEGAEPATLAEDAGRPEGPSFSRWDEGSSWQSLSINRYTTRGEFFRLTANASLFFLVLFNIGRRRQFRRILYVIVTVGMGISLLGILQKLAGSPEMYWFWRPSDWVPERGGGFGPFVNPNHFAAYMGMSIPLALGALLWRLGPSFHADLAWPGVRGKLIWLENFLSASTPFMIALLIMVVGLFMSLSRGGFLSLVAALIFLSVLVKSRKRFGEGARGMVALVILVGFLAALWVGFEPLASRLLTFVERGESLYEYRVVVWRQTLPLIQDFPAFGTGLGTFVHIFPKYKEFVAKFLFAHAENDYLQILAEVGFTGFLCAMTFLVLYFRQVIKLWWARHDHFIVCLTMGGLSAAVAFLVHSFTNFNIYNPPVATLFSVILALTLSAASSPSRGGARSGSKAGRLSPLRRGAMTTFAAAGMVGVLFAGWQILSAYMAASNLREFRVVNKGAAFRGSYPNSPAALLARSMALDPLNPDFPDQMARLHLERSLIHQRLSTQRVAPISSVSLHAEEAFRHGRMALNYSAQALNLDPTSSERNYFLASNYATLVRHLRRLDGGLDSSGAAAESVKRLKEATRRRLSAASGYGWLSRKLDTAAEFDPTNPRYHFLKGEYYLGAGDEERALLNLRKAVAIDNYLLDLALRRVWFRTKSFEKLEQLFPPEPRYYTKLALFHSKVGGWDEGIRAFEKAVELSKHVEAEEAKPPLYRWGGWHPFSLPGSDLEFLRRKEERQIPPIGESGVRRLYASISFYRGEYERAIHQWEKVLAKEPADGEVAFFMARAYESWGKKEKALDYYEKAERADPLSKKYKYALMAYYYRRGRYEQVESYADQILDVDPYQARAHYWKGLSYEKTGRREEAIRHLKKAIRLNPKDEWYYVAIARIFLSMDMLAEANYYLKRCLELNPNNKTAEGLIGVISRRMKAIPQVGYVHQ